MRSSETDAALRTTATMLAARLSPRGIPGLRDRMFDLTSRVTPPGLDPAATPGDPGLFGPDSVTWRIMDEPAHALTGLRAALLQTLSVPIPSATHSTGRFYSDFVGRVQRTGQFIERQCLGSMDEVLDSAIRVRRMHARVKGATPSGLAYDASDPHQQAWVSMTLTESMLAVLERFGTRALTLDEANQLVAEQAVHGALLDPRLDLVAIARDPARRAALQAGQLPLPLIEEGEIATTVAGLKLAMHAWDDELRVNGLTRTLLDTLVEGRMPAPQRAAVQPFVLAVLSTVPEPWHGLLSPNGDRRSQRIAAAGVSSLVAGLRAVAGPNPSVRVARDRVLLHGAAGAPPVAA